MRSMQAAVIDIAGPPESFRVVETATPSPGEAEVLIRQKYASLNFGDVIRRKRGLFPPDVPPPYVLGFEGVGVVSEVGRLVKGVRVGDRVAYLAERGGYAECVVAPASQTWLVPDSISDESAAGITCVGLTAWGLIAQSGIRPSDVAVVHGASGGVGSILVQMLSAQGIRTIALVKGAEKQSFVSTLGADTVLDRADGNVEANIKKASPAGADVVFDCVGQDVVDLNLAVIRPGGVWMYFGSTSGHATFPGDRVLMNRLSVRGFVVFEFARDASAWRQGTAFLSSVLERGHLRSQTTQIFPLAQVSEGHRLLEERRSMGKIVLRM